jgi:ketosteroid isomerase-like protein
MYLSFVACIRLVVTQKSFAKCWRVMFAERLLTDFRTVGSTWALTVCFVIFFGRLFADFDEFVANGSEFFESGERVIALGSYSGRARRTGKSFTARFAHVWTLQDGLIVRLQQCADTVQLARGLAD